MNARRRHFVWTWLLILALVALTGWVGPRTTAAELDKLDTALKLVPADAAFYSAMMRNREQLEAIAGSNAWAKLREMPVVQMGLMFYNMQLSTPESGPAKLQAALENPETRKILDLLADMASDEMFVYGDQSCVEFLGMLQEVNGASRFGPLVMMLTDIPGDDSRKNPQATAIISALADQDELAVPNMVFGFRVKNAELAKEQLIKLETIANLVLESQEQTKGRFKKTKVGDHDYLVLTLDGGMIPWDEMPLDELKKAEAEEGQVDKIIAQLKEAKLVLALGLRGEYLLLSIGSSLECLEQFGQGESLINREEFKPLARFADRRLTSIGYVSKELNERLNSQKKDIDDLLEVAETLLPLAELDEEKTERIRKDLKAFAEDIKASIPVAGPALSFSFLCERGIEGYQYNWGENKALDGSQPLGLLRHMGGNPILGLIGRGKTNPADYDTAVKWLRTGYGYFREFGLPLIQESEREKIESFLKEALPLLERLDKANREMLIPALADGQVALVLDAKFTSKQFHQEQPPTEKPMPMIEPALVIGLSDAKLFNSALEEYWHVINGLIAALKNVEGTDIPDDFALPEPQSDVSSENTVYYYALPKDWGFDERIVPNLAISEKAAVISFTREHAARLLKPTPPAVGGLLEKPDRPLAAAGWLNWAALIDAATPWIDYALENIPGLADAGEDQRKAVADQVHTALEVLKVMRSITGETYFEDNALVTHTLVEIRDVGK
jgi:hypothetical protein